MIRILINDETTTVSVNNLEELVKEINPEQGAFAVALNQEFVPRSEYNATPIQEGDNLEFLSPMQGG